MKNYHEFIEKLQQDVTVPETVWNQFENTLEQLPEIPAAGRRTSGKMPQVRWGKMAGAAAAVVVAGTAVLGYTNPVLAAKIPIVGSFFEMIEDDLTFSGEYSSVGEFLEVDPEEEIAEEAAAESENENAESGEANADQEAAANYSASDQGVEITFSEIYSDGLSIYATAQISVEQGGLENIPGHYTEGYVSENAATSQTLYTGGEWQAEGQQSPEALENNNFEGKAVDDHTFVGMIKLDMDALNTEGGVLELQLNRIGYDDLGELDGEDISETHRIEGTWQFSIPYHVDAESVKQIAVNQKNEAGYGVREVVVSPYQVVVYTDVPYTTLTEGEVSYEYCDIKVFNQDGEELLMTGGDFEKMVFAVKDKEITKLNIFMSGNEDGTEPLFKQKDMEAAAAAAEFAAEVDVK